MSDTLTIVTSDNPPVSFPIPRAILVVGSRVFADLLSLPVSSSADAAGSVDANKGSVTVSETQKQIEPFLATLRGEKVSLGEVEWEDLARLSDKYDSFVVKRTVAAYAWCVSTIAHLLAPFRLTLLRARELAAKQSSVLHCFTLGSLLGENALLNFMATAALDYKRDPKKRFGASPYWINRLVRAPRGILCFTDSLESCAGVSP